MSQLSVQNLVLIEIAVSLSALSVMQVFVELPNSPGFMLE